MPRTVWFSTKEISLAGSIFQALLAHNCRFGMVPVRRDHSARSRSSLGCSSGSNDVVEQVPNDTVKISLGVSRKKELRLGDEVRVEAKVDPTAGAARITGVAIRPAAMLNLLSGSEEQAGAPGCPPATEGPSP